MKVNNNICKKCQHYSSHEEVYKITFREDYHVTIEICNFDDSVRWHVNEGSTMPEHCIYKLEHMVLQDKKEMTKDGNYQNKSVQEV